MNTKCRYKRYRKRRGFDMEHNANKGNSSGQTDLMIACKTGNVAAVSEILEWRDDDGKRVDISARDENGQTALSFAKQSNNAEIVAMIERHLFLRAVENGDIETMKTYLTAKESNLEQSDNDILSDHYEHNSEQMEIQTPEDDAIEEPSPNRFKRGIEAEFTSKDSITRSDRLEAIDIARHNFHDDMLDLLFNNDRFINEFNEDRHTILYQAVAEYLAAEYSATMANTSYRKLKTVEILFKSGKFGGQILNLREKIFELVCRKKPKHFFQIDGLLRGILLQNGIGLNGTNKYGETLLMLAYENERIDIVRSLLNIASRESVLDIDAVDNFGETALMKAKERRFYEFDEELLKFKFLSAVRDENADAVRSMIAALRNTLDVLVKSWRSNQDLDSMFDERKTRSDIWLEAMYIALENNTTHSEEIQKLLLDCDILISQEIETGYSVFDPSTHQWLLDDDEELRLKEVLLKSGKINANDRDKYGRTALHWADEEKLILLLIRYGADVNRKDNEGKTPLMPISDNPDEERLPVLLTLLDEAGTLANLDAMDCSGKTALMHAVILHRSHDVELLLSKGASVNLSDHLGFTALHHALHVNINRHYKFPRNSEGLKKIKELAIFFTAEKPHQDFNWYIERNDEWSEERMQVVEMLLHRPDIDVNLLSIEMLSPLDIAEGQIPDIPSSIKNSLIEKGAVLNVFRQTESQSTSEFYLDFTHKFTLKQLKKTLNALNTTNLDFLKERWLALIESFKEQKVLNKDQQGRTALHLVAISFYNSGLEDEDYVMDLANAIVDKLISLGCNVNEPDIFGRTPLHYANRMFWKLLITKEADLSVKDKDGNIAIEKPSRESSRRVSLEFLHRVEELRDRNDETYLLRLLNNKQMKINVQGVDSHGDGHGDSDGDGDGDSDSGHEEVTLETAPELLWEEGEYASHHRLANQVTKEVTDLIPAIAKEIERLDPRFEIRSEFVGSSYEGTRVGKPDEFDFCFVLTKISELCKIYQSPELPTGFLRLKRKPTKVDKASDFDTFFGNDGILNTVKLNWQFTTILSKAVVNINSQLSFKWILLLMNNYTHDSHNIKKVSNIQMTKPLNSFTVDKISVDIVPCIHIDGFWPDDAISNVSDEIKKFGCNLVFDRPQELYPWVPYSESCARISFSKAESEMIKQSCNNAKEAYMIGWTMVEKSIYVSKYNLKNCLLYCIETLSPSSEKASKLELSLEEMKSKFNKIDHRYLWLKCLLRCHLEFIAQDFCPCFFLSTFSNCSLFKEDEGHYLKKVSFDWIADRPSDFPLACKDACALYRCTSNDISESSYQLPAPDPLWERFDRKQLIKLLCEIAYK